MHAENTFIYDGSYRKMVEHAAVLTPKTDRVTALALIVETVKPRDGDALVVSA